MWSRSLYFIIPSLCMAHLNIIWAPSPNYGDRIDKTTGQPVDKPTILVMHYTVSNLSQTLGYFENGTTVSSHYTIAENGSIFQHVDEKYRAWHAGAGQWRSIRDVNSHSIGIEHVNAGYKLSPNQPTGTAVPGSPFEWYPFENAQIQASVRLSKEIVRRYDIKHWNVIGHSDHAVARKLDPGPLYPWHEYANHGIGAWISNELIQYNFSNEFIQYNSNYTILDMQEKLFHWGYTGVPKNGILDWVTRKTLIAFQMHYRPANISGELDDQTISIMNALLKMYPS